MEGCSNSGRLLYSPCKAIAGSDLDIVLVEYDWHWGVDERLNLYSFLSEAELVRGSASHVERVAGKK